MSEFSDYMENKIIDHFLRYTTVSPATVYVALFTSSTGLETNAPTAEVSGGAYTRQAAGIGSPSGGTADNDADIEFATATAAWGTVSHVALVDHDTNTTWGTNVNVLMWSPLDASKTVDSGDQFKISAGDLDVTVT